MSFLVTDNQISYMNADAVKLLKQLPVGIYKTSYNQFQGTFLEKTTLKLAHGKVYGKSQAYANHVCASFRKRKQDPALKEKNLGVLFSGGRGLGKTLTTRLIIDELKDEFPVITVSSYTPDLSKFLENITDSIILMDEFEKFMAGNVEGTDNDNAQTKQETLLSIFDGNSGSKGNLFLLTSNSIGGLDENLLSRPGRILYHYKYASERNDVIEAYCKDNLNRKEIIPEVIETLSASKYVSMDIITAFVQELNDFPELSPKEVQEYFNIEQDTDYTLRVHAIVRGIHVIYEDVIQPDQDWDIENNWLKMTPSSRKEIEKSGKFPETDGDDCMLFPRIIRFSLSRDAIPRYIIGQENIDINQVIVDMANDNFDVREITLVKAEIIDKKASSLLARTNPQAV